MKKKILSYENYCSTYSSPLQFLHKKFTKSFNMKYHTTTVNVPVNKLTLKYLQILTDRHFVQYYCYNLIMEVMKCFKSVSKTKMGKS